MTFLSRFLLLLLPLLALSWVAPAYAQEANTCPATLRHTLPRLQDEQPQNLCQYAGKVILVVNTASYCGFTTQYEGLEKLHDRYQSQGLVVLGFASNDFGQQEPGSNKEIAAFCYNTFGVRFPMFAKSSVSGSTANPFYRALMAAGATQPQWNFHKILLDRKGRVIRSYASRTRPDDKALLNDIKHALADTH